MAMKGMDGMDSELYSEEPTESPKEETEGKDEEEHGSDLMSKSSFPGDCKVGDRYEIEITGDHGDQFGVKVVKDEHEEMDEGQELESMNSKY